MVISGYSSEIARICSPGLFRLMQAVGDQGMGVFVEHGVSFVRLLPGGASLTRPTVRCCCCRVALRLPGLRFGAVVGPVSAAPPGEQTAT